MEALISDIKSDLILLKKEANSIDRKLKRLRNETDPENVDSHIKAIAGTLHSIYTGCETVLERIIRAIDGDTPLGKDYHLMILRRAITPIENVRPAIISTKIFNKLDELRTYRHKFRNIYLYLLSGKRIKEMAIIGLKLVEDFEKDINKFLEFMTTENKSGGKK